jgi:GntR family transcriptional repressor for pyruvate dehydrogenase complex
MTTHETAFRPLVPPPNLKDVLIERLTDEIKRGALQPGEKLPTEQEMIAAFGVSRTVVREALAALRAEGLIVTRQGAGAFVAEDMRSRPFRMPGDGPGNVAQAIRINELRLGIEVESAGLAAERRNARELAAIEASLLQFDEAVERGEDAVEADVAFHRAIAEATHNENFVAFLAWLGWHIIPRRIIQQNAIDDAVRRNYLRRVAGEHRAIADAIAKQDPIAARRAMRRHLKRSLKRYHAIGDGEGA